MAAPNPISYIEIEAWARLTGSEPSHWEISVLRRMDAAALAKSATRSGSIGDREPTRTVDADDGREMIGFLRGKGARKG